MTNEPQKASLLERITTVGYSLAAAGAAVGVLAGPAAGVVAAVGALVAGSAALAAGATGVVLAAGATVGDKQTNKTSREFSSAALAAAALSFGLTAYAQQDQIDGLESRLDNAITVEQTEPVTQALETGATSKSKLEDIASTAITEFSRMAIAQQENAQEKVKQICNDNAEIFETADLPCPAQP